MADFKVIIIGGGLSGTLLANGLINNKVDCILYERDLKNSDREGYQIRLGDGAMAGFKACLSPSDEARVLDKLGQSFGVSKSAPAIYNGRFEQIIDLSVLPSYSKTAAINRVVLRDMMMETVEKKGRVSYGKQFLDYEEVIEAGKKSIKVNFDDGSSALCDLLIGADGSRSKLNKQLGLNNLVHLNQYWSFMSKGPVPYKRIAELPEQLLKGPLLIFTKRATIYYALYLPAEKTKGSSVEQRAIQYDEEAASFFWVVNIHVNDLPENPDQIEDRASLLLNHAQRWAPEYRRMLSIGINDKETSKIYMTQAWASKQPSSDWRIRSRDSNDARKGHPQVWMIGDAIHAMQPNRPCLRETGAVEDNYLQGISGQGGNQALRDCAEILPHIVHLNEKAKSDSTSSLEKTAYEQACKAYEDTMIPRAFSWVRKSGGASTLELNLDSWMGTVIKASSSLLMFVLRIFYRA